MEEYKNLHDLLADAGSVTRETLEYLDTWFETHHEEVHESGDEDAIAEMHMAIDAFNALKAGHTLLGLAFSIKRPLVPDHVPGDWTV